MKSKTICGKLAIGPYGPPVHDPRFEDFSDQVKELEIRIKRIIKTQNSKKVSK